MFRHDFIIRILKRFINALILIIRLRREQQYQAARELIGQMWEELFGLPSDTIHAVSERTLFAMLKADEPDNVDTCLMVARLFKEDGDLAVLQNKQDEGHQRYLKALNLYLEVAVHPSIPPDTFRLRFDPADHADLSADDVAVVLDTHADIEHLVRKFDRHILPEATQRKLFAYYEKFGRYAKAEDVLFDLLDHTRGDADTVEIGTGFYRRLLDKSDAELRAGGLPRDEVREGLKQVQNMGE